MRVIFAILFLSVAIQAQNFDLPRSMTSNLPTAPQPNTMTLMLAPVQAHALTEASKQLANNWYGHGFQTDNQQYMLQGYAVSFAVGVATKRPWMGAAAGVGSCLAYRAIHDQGYANDHLFSSNRVAFCAAGSVAAYVTNKWMFRIRRNKRLG
jgi:hypothetical protein